MTISISSLLKNRLKTSKTYIIFIKSQRRYTKIIVLNSNQLTNSHFHNKPRIQYALKNRIKIYSPLISEK